MAETTQLETPAALGYRMPAEWEPHAATWLSWPRRDGISFPDSYDRVMPVLAKMVHALADKLPAHLAAEQELLYPIVARQLSVQVIDERRSHWVAAGSRTPAWRCSRASTAVSGTWRSLGMAARPRTLPCRRKPSASRQISGATPMGMRSSWSVAALIAPGVVCTGSGWATPRFTRSRTRLLPGA